MRALPLLFVLSLLLTSEVLFSQSISDSISNKSDTSQTLDFPEKKASFKGGESAFYKYISNNVKYPKDAIKNKIEGKIVVQFTVNKDGRIIDVSTLGKTLGYGLEEEAIRVIKNMPKWEPAVQKGKNVAMRFQIPINFSLPEDEITPVPITKKKVIKKNNAYDLP